MRYKRVDMERNLGDMLAYRERLMSIPRHTSPGERLDGWDGLGFP